MLLQLKTINSENGLPNDQIHNVRQDVFGRLWLTGPVGLICYNGSNIKVYDRRSGIKCIGLRTITISKEGIIWIGTDRGLEAIDLNGKVKQIDLNFDWTFGIVESILLLDAEIWLGTSHGLIILKNGEENDIFEIDFVIDFGLVSDILNIDDDNFLLLTAQHGLIIFEKYSWKVFNPFLPSGDAVLCIAKTTDNYLLVGTNNGLYQLDPGGSIFEHFYLSEENKVVTAIIALGDEWWIGFGSILVQARPGTYGIEVQETIKVASRIKDLFADKVNNIWVATNNDGIVKITCLREALQQIDCEVEGPVFSIKKSGRNGQLLVSGDGFCTSIQDSQQDYKVNLISEFSSIVWNSCVDPIDESVMWFATQDGLYKSVGRGKPQRFREDVIHSANRVLLDRKEEIWLGTISGLFCIKNNEVEEKLNGNGSKFGYVYSLGIDSEGARWIGTLGQGLWKETENGFIHFHDDLISEFGNIYSLASNEYGQMLVIQEENVISIDAGSKTKFVFQEYPLAGWSCAWMDRNTIAIGSNHGLNIVNINNQKVVSRIASHLDKSGWQFTATNSLYFNSDGRFLCGINAGLFSVDYEKLERFSKPPTPSLDEIVWFNYNPTTKNGVYQLPTGKWSVNVSFYAAWFVDENQLKYRFKLVGFDETWSKFQSTPSVTYNSLPPGDYQLQVQAYTPLTDIGEVVEVLKMNVSIPFWTSVINPVISTFSSAYRSLFQSKARNQKLLERNAELQIEINERKIVETELRNYKSQLEDLVANRTRALLEEKEKAVSASKTKTQFLANMSHAIRTPISGIIGLNNLLAKTRLDEKQSDYVEKINYSVNHLSQVINDILDITKIEAGKIELEQVPFSIQELIVDLDTFGKLQAFKKDIEFSVDLQMDSDSYFVGDPLRIKQILLNLLSNAMKFTYKGSVKLKIEQINTIKDESVLCFEVADTGIGMSGQQLEKLFKPFEQADLSTSRKFGGTGLGLNISTKFAEMMNSEIKVKSEPKKGSIFYFTLQLKTANAPEEAGLIENKSLQKNLISTTVDESTNGNSPEKLIVKNKYGKILVAEDDTVNQLVIRRMLEMEGFEVQIVSSGKEAVDVLSTNSDFDLILMDIQMPEMDGIQATEYIRNILKNKDIKIIALSADAMLETKKQVLEVGMNDYMIKPLKRQDIQEIFEKWIRQYS